MRLSTESLRAVLLIIGSALVDAGAAFTLLLTGHNQVHAGRTTTAFALPRGVSEINRDKLMDEEKTIAASPKPFAIPPARLITLAKDAAQTGVGLENPDLLAEDFTFVFPVVGPLTKDQYLKAVKSFDLYGAFPDLNPQYFNFAVDPLEPSRVWYLSRAVATHKGKGGFGFEPTGTEIESPPQILSLTFNENGEVIKFTGGYVADRTAGNTGGLGGVFGLLYAIGHPLPFREARPWKMSLRYRLFNWLGRLRQKRAEAKDLPVPTQQFIKDDSSSLRLKDIEFSQPINKYALMAKPDLFDVSDMDKTRPSPAIRHSTEPLRNRPLDLSLKTDDVDGATPNLVHQAHFYTLRQTNPVDPHYVLPTCEKAPVPPPPYRRETNAHKDIEGTQSKSLFRPVTDSTGLLRTANLNVGDIEGTFPDHLRTHTCFRYVTQNPKPDLCLKVKGITGPQTRVARVRGTHPLDPIYELPQWTTVDQNYLATGPMRMSAEAEQTKLQKKETIGPIHKNKPRPRVWTHGEPFYSLETNDIPGATSGRFVGTIPWNALTSPQRTVPLAGYLPKTGSTESPNLDTKNPVRVEDIEGAQAMTKPKGIERKTQRELDPLAPDYPWDSNNNPQRTYMRTGPQTLGPVHANPNDPLDTLHTATAPPPPDTSQGMPTSPPGETMGATMDLLGSQVKAATPEATGVIQSGAITPGVLSETRAAPPPGRGSRDGKGGVGTLDLSAVAPQVAATHRSSGRMRNSLSGASRSSGGSGRGQSLAERLGAFVGTGNTIGKITSQQKLKSLDLDNDLRKLKDSSNSQLEHAEVEQLFPLLPVTLEELDFAFSSLNDAEAKELFPSLPAALEHLDFGRQFDLKSPGWALLRARLKSLKRLNKLSCSGNKRIGIVGSASLGERLKSLEGLKRLGLRDCTLTNDKVEQFFPSIPLALEDLDLAENPRIGPEGWASLGARLQSLEQLKKLNLNSCTLYDQKVESLFPSLPTTLEELSVRGGAHLCKAGWLALGARMKSLKHLKKLDLSTCAYLLSFTSTPVLPHLYHLFPLLPDTLEEVDFHCNSSIGIAGWKSLGVRLKSLERLKKLNLSECALNDEIVEQLFPSLPALLEELDIQGNSSIGIAGWKSLGASLKGLRRLKMLDLNDCGLKNLATEHEDVAKIAVHSAAHVGFCLNAQ
uniref:Uncharacterized protein n=1 Tax=Chromera velia CCMP2878 TaxID=1169474 RepID=A0A0G4FTC6_9ALVE|eukprot:Cvel_3735.t1-p1 / transcript=Cvel_3735.t1 / gene=Cvel_3735 / organism=Chromera_velia_CCMP2878 / gene_product=Leucine-rich repeat-containing protein 31, putative / transcript_product=Leucine-rich repeat-containing protein 31, putative / location=Cvel_scaffold155:90175-116873(-) / protein_length=1167 / sequence_SO=supercontig / SO=protein_coding / is_pseudo=false